MSRPVVFLLALANTIGCVLALLVSDWPGWYFFVIASLIPTIGAWAALNPVTGQRSRDEGAEEYYEARRRQDLSDWTSGTGNYSALDD